MTDKKDLGLKVATIAEEMWIRVRDGAIQRLKIAEENTIVEKEIVKLSKNKILLEQRK